MKITYLTSFVTIALLSAVASANVIPAKVAALPTIKRSSPAVDGLTEVLAPLASITSPRSDLAFPDIGGSENTIFTRGQSNSNKGGENNHHHDNNNNDNDRRDIRYLNLFLLLEEFLTAFFERGLSRYSQQDFLRAGYPEWVRGRYEQIYKHEKIHKEFIQSAITASGGEYVRPCRYEFNDNDVHAFVDMSEALETISASAYTGSLQYISNKAYITTGASILAVEARHAAWINSAVRKQNPWNTAFETPLTPNEVVTLLSNCFDFQSCPSGNAGLLPEGLRPAPRLSLAPRLIPGQEAEISFPDNNIGQGERLYAAFLTGIETIFVAVEERSENGGNHGSGNGNNGSGNGGNENHGENENHGGNNNGGNNNGGQNNGSHGSGNGNNGSGNGGGENHGGNNNGGQNNGGHGSGSGGNENHNGSQNGGDHGSSNGRNGGGSSGNENHGSNNNSDHNGSSSGNNENNRSGINNEGNNRNNEGNNHNGEGNNHNGENHNGGGNNHNGENHNGENHNGEGNNNHNGDNHNGEKQNGEKHNGENHNGEGPNRNNQGNNSNNNQGNNRKRFFVEIPRDLEGRGTVFVLIVRGPQNIREVSLNTEHIVAGPAIAMFPFDSNGKSIGW